MSYSPETKDRTGQVRLDDVDTYFFDYGGIRESYINDILSINPFDKAEEVDIKSTLEWLKTEKNINKPYNPTTHLGVLAALLSEDKSQIFLLKHRKSGLWLPPGGHVDLGSTFEEATVLELREELGVGEVTLIGKSPFFLNRTLTQGLNAGHIDITVWMLVAGNPEEKYNMQEKEASEGKWVTIQNILQDATLSHLHRPLRKIE